MRSLRIAALAAAVALAPLAANAAERGDTWLTTKAKLAVLKETGTTGTKISVKTNDGLVTLIGKVSSDEDSKAAEAAVRQLDGVKEVRNLLEVVAPKKLDKVEASDSDVQKKVTQKLQNDPLLKSESGIEVESVDNGTVVLSGKASTLAKHLQAVEDARSVPGVKRVASTIESPDSKAVRDGVLGAAKSTKESSTKAADSAKSKGEGLGDKMSDAYITTKAKAGLLADSDTRGASINVDTKEGEVTLAGTVKDAAQKKHAEEKVAALDGVKSVKNELEIVPAASQDRVSKKDTEAERNVKKAVSNDKALSDASISVEVNNGVARLTGTAPTEKARKEAGKVAMRAGGVKSVRNEIEVKSE